MQVKRFLPYIFGIFFLFQNTASAQCAMCRAVLESEGSGNTAQAVNDGIVYLMVVPYLLLIVVGWGIYRVMKNKKPKTDE
ncbi:hypothetical protein AB4865_09045 [Capnocytophaga sp. ARDL2]|uniref:hypothetical protein n=1 Tax=Capnocytophaga sp. ARDL2 TaxID=3238809 RepID=UPI003557F6CC